MIDIINFVKHALSNEGLRESIKNKLIKASKSSPNDMLGLLINIRNEIFPNNADPTIQPEEMFPEFIDFLDATDDTMWPWIEEKYNHLSDSVEDQEGLKIIYDLVNELVDNNRIFSDKVYVEKDLDNFDNEEKDISFEEVG